MADPTGQQPAAVVLKGVSKRFKRRTIRAEYTSFKTELPNLEDVFLTLTGHSIRE